MTGKTQENAEPIRLDQIKLEGEWVYGIVLALLVFAAYIPALCAGFFWEDEKYVTHNPMLQRPDALRTIWLSIEFQQYQPLALTSHWIERQIFGLNPLPFHALNILLHTLNALLVWRILKRLAAPAPWLIAAAFALHPVCVESVAWITEHKTLLSAFFYLLAVWSWLNFDERRAWKWYAAALGCYLLALCAKTVSSSLPVILILIGWMRGKTWRELRRDALLAVPFFAVGLPLGLLTAFMERDLIGAQGPEWNHSFAERILLCGRALWFYALKDIFPCPLMFEYPRWKLDTSDWRQWACIAGVLAATAALIPHTRRWGRKPAAALLFFAITLFPALGFANVYPHRFSFVADHFQYLGSLGIIALLVGAASSLIVSCATGSDVAASANTQGASARAANSKAARATQLRFGAAVLLVVLATLVWFHSSTFKDDETVWRDTLGKNNDAWLAHNNLGVILFNRGDTDGALEHYQLAWRSGPQDTEVLTKLGDVYALKRMRSESRQSYEKALSLTPATLLKGLAPRRPCNIVASVYRPFFHIPPETLTIYERKRIGAADAAYIGLGRLDAADGNGPSALARFAQAMELSPKSAKPYLARAEFYRQAGKVSEALEDCAKAGALDPQSTLPSFIKAQILRDAGKADDAITAFRATLTLDARHIGALVSLGALLKEKGLADEALVPLRKALDLNPVHEEALFHMGTIMLARGDLTSATEFFRRAVVARPSFTDARLYLAVVVAAKGQMHESIALVKKMPLNEISKADGLLNLALIFHGAKIFDEELNVLRYGMNRYKTDAVARAGLQDQLAWLLATCPDDKLRNGQEALALAKELVSPENPTAQALDTLAAAQGETTDFKAAIDSATRARELAKSDPSKSEFVRQIDEQLKRFNAGQPYREAGN